MGVRHTTLASLNATTSATGDDFSKEILESDPHLANVYEVDRYLFPGSGRMMRTFQLKHKENGCAVVVKLMFLTQEELQDEDGHNNKRGGSANSTDNATAATPLEPRLVRVQQDLAKIRQKLQELPHMAPFLYWFVGPYRPYAMNMVRPAILVRPQFYTTLSDRLASRPFLTHVEKLWIAFQLLRALDGMHSKNVVHGFLTTENIGLSSWNWVVLMDFASYKARTMLPDDDPSEYLYYFQELFNQQGSDSTPREKRCYVAPERFYTPSHQEQRQSEDGKDNESTANISTEKQQLPLTPAMDIFSAGCIIMETFLNGERAFDLGDLMEYRKRQSSQSLQQKLNKIEFSSLRAACRHMVSLDPRQRLSAKAYLERLEAAELVPTSFAMLSHLMVDVTAGEKGSQSVMTPDARMAKAAAFYAPIIYETMGISDVDGKRYFEKALGVTSAIELGEKTINARSVVEIESVSAAPALNIGNDEKKESEGDRLLAETEALLRQLETLSLDDGEILASTSNELSSEVNPNPANAATLLKPKIERSLMSQNSLLVYLQLVLATARHVQRPASKLVALQLMQRISRYSTDEARLQRIVPVTVSFLRDQDPLVRAAAIQVLTTTISIVDSFPPSDSKVFPQYIFKRIAHLVTDPSLVVRLSFARSVAMLAETSHRFLDISHAVRLYEAVGGGSGGSASNEGEEGTIGGADNVFGDDVAKLLDSSDHRNDMTKVFSHVDPSVSGAGEGGKTLISSTYNSELGALHDIVSRWVVHIATDFSEHSSPAKRALLSDMARLCNFFGLDGVMAFILPQILSFLNDRKDWQLRASLFGNLQPVCHIIGRAATEHFVLPILETGLVDSHEAVIGQSLHCLSQLLRTGHISRGAFLGGTRTNSTNESYGLLKKYSPLLLHPSSAIRSNMIATVNALCELVGELDAEIFVVSVIKPFIRFHPSSRLLMCAVGLEKCLYPARPREDYEKELNRLVLVTEASPTAGQWTSIALQIKEGQADSIDPEGNAVLTEEKSKSPPPSQKESLCNEQDLLFRSYLQMLARGRTSARKNASGDDSNKQDMSHAIEGSLKLAQQIKFPRQDLRCFLSPTLPLWYGSMRENQKNRQGGLGETTAIRSVSVLGQVFGLSIMDQAGGAVVSDGTTAESATRLANSKESRIIKAAGTGEWGSESSLDPALVDTSLLLTKLGALHVPPLPPKMSAEREAVASNTGLRQASRQAGDPKESHIFKPKIDTVIATSKRALNVGHIAPVVRVAVSHDQKFFVSGSHDGTCMVWESENAEKSNGVLESSLTYSMHKGEGNPPRVNDLAMLEGSHTVASGASDGSVHVWRVDLVSSSSSNVGESNRDSRRVAGSSDIRKMNPSEGEVLAVNQYNTPGASVLTYATQIGRVHSWDLRSAHEPFCLHTFQDTGYITSMAVGGDRHWAAVGTSRGFIAIWDLRFQQIMKLWRHSNKSAINRLATSFVPPPQSWSGRGYHNIDSKPYLFVASGPNECGMFDAMTGHCSECFRTVEYGTRRPSSRIDGPPKLDEMPLSASARRKATLNKGSGLQRLDRAVSASFQSINCIVGSTGANDYSFLVTGGSDCRIRCWDFSMPSRCFSSCGIDPVQPRPSFERIDFDQNSRLMLCRQAPTPTLNEVDSSKVPRKLFQGTRAIPQGHSQAIMDMKFLKNSLVSCSRDCTVKIWR